MTDELHALNEVQLVDIALRDLDQRIASAPGAIENVHQEIERERAERKRAEDAVEENGRTRRKAEGELQDAESQVEKSQEQLLAARSNVEYDGLLKQIETGKQRVGEIEERIILLMDDGDRLGAELRTAGEVFAAAESRLKADEEAIREEVVRNEKERERLRGERNRIVAGISAPTMERYERLRGTRHGLAVAGVRNGRCVVCNMVLRPQMYEEVRVGSALLNCESCGLILFFEPEPASQSA